MKIVVFGLSISSSWGNGHATLWRGLCKALAELGHETVFYERDVPYYAEHRDMAEPPGCSLRLYRDFASIARDARRELASSDVAMVTSYCPDAITACDLVLDAGAGSRVFYDLDTPITLAGLASGQRPAYLPEQGLGEFDLVLSYTGGRALEALRDRLGAKRAVPLYGSVDPEVHRPVPPVDEYRADLSYLGTFAADRQAAVDALFLEPARRLPGKRFLLGGALYPTDFPWTKNVWFRQHVPPSDHAAFYSSSHLTLNVTRAAMAEMGWCPSGRLFEAAACGAPILSDTWEGLDRFFAPKEEILVASGTDDAIAALRLGPAELARIARRARERTLDEHTAMHRARELVAVLEDATHAARPHHRPSMEA